jgi:hypothetical protein
MKILTVITMIFLVFGLLGVPSGVFAQESSSVGADIISQHSNSMVVDNMVPLLKGSRGGFSSSSKIHHADVDDVSDAASDDSTGGDGSGWLTIIIIIIIIAIIAIAVWYFFLRK